jgi:hypothetical protein
MLHTGVDDTNPKLQRGRLRTRWGVGLVWNVPFLSVCNIIPSFGAFTANVNPGLLPNECGKKFWRLLNSPEFRQLALVWET